MGSYMNEGCTSLSDHLWTAQVEINGITIILSQQSCLKEHLWIIGTKLTHRGWNTDLD